MPDGNTDEAAGKTVGDWRVLPVKSFWAYVLFVVTACYGVVAAYISPLISDWIKAALGPQVSATLLQAFPLWVFLLSVVPLYAGTLGVVIYVLNRIDAARIKEGKGKVEAERRVIAEQGSERDKLLRKLDEQKRDFENLEMLYRDSERRRLLDPVTGIPNFQSWETDLRKWAQQGRSEREHSLLLIDFDKIKWINERNPDGSCADQILRHIAQKTYSSMRRDEHVYKLPEEFPEMYRHYQGGDEFFFILSGDVFDAIGFVNRLAGRMRAYQNEMHDTILVKYLSGEDLASFELTFSCAIIAIHPGTEPKEALPNAYRLLSRAKASPRSRLLAIFDTHYEYPEDCRADLQDQLARIKRQLDGAPRQEAEKVELEATARQLSMQIGLLANAQQLFKPSAPRGRD